MTLWLLNTCKKSEMNFRNTEVKRRQALWKRNKSFQSRLKMFRVIIKKSARFSWKLQSVCLPLSGSTPSFALYTLDASLETVRTSSFASSTTSSSSRQYL